MKNFYNYISYLDMWEDIRKYWLEDIRKDWLEDIDEFEESLDEIGLSKDKISSLKSFVLNPNLPIMKDECKLVSANEILFVFGKDLDEAFESDPKKSYTNIYIQYDFEHEIFTDFSVELG